MRWYVVLILGTILCLSVHGQTSVAGGEGLARQWSDLSGHFKIEAELVEVAPDGKSVTLRRTDGEKINMPVDALSEADRKFLHQARTAGDTRRADANPFLTNKDRSGAADQTSKLGHRRALLIGVNEYKNFRKLNYCGADVQAVGKRLALAGFNADKVVVIQDAAMRSLQPDKEKIVTQIKLLLEASQPDDLVLLAFAGHGVRVGGKSYLAPYEAEPPQSPQDEASLKTLISLDWVYEELQACPAGMKIFLVDACQNRLFKGDQRSVERGVPLESIGQSLEHAPKGVLQLTACAAGEVSHESESLGHGVYTHFLLEALEGKADYNHDGVISLKEASLYTSDRTEEYVRVNFSATQRPSFRGELQGDAPLAECLLMDRITVPDDIDKLDVALRRAAEGATITIKPGLYTYATSLRITRNVTIQGATSDPHDVTLECSGGAAIVMAAERARIQGVSIRGQAAGKDDWSERCAVYIPQGKLEIHKCDITSKDASGIHISGEKANPTVSYCTIHDAAGQGIWADKGCNGMFQECDIFGNKSYGVFITGGAHPTFTRCKICDGKDAGVDISDKGFGTFEDCDIARNERAGVWVQTDSNPTFKGCKIHDGKGAGVYVQYKGFGTFEDCDIVHNETFGVYVGYDSNPTFKGCKIHDGKGAGVYVEDKGFGTFEDNDIARNENPGVWIRTDGNPTFKGCKIHDGKNDGVYVHDKGFGTFDDCDIFGHVSSGVDIKTDGNPTFKNCKIYDGKDAGVYVHDKGFGTFEDCDIARNENPGVGVRTDGNPTVKGCKIHGGKFSGVTVRDNGKGVFENNTLYGNARGDWDIENNAGEVRRVGNSPNN